MKIEVVTRPPRSAVAFAALCLSICFGVAGQLLMKSAALHTVGAVPDWTLVVVLSVALLVYSFGVVNWIVALRYLQLSIAYPLTSLSYVGILGGAHYWFGERISAERILGVLLIFIGVMLVVLRSPAQGQGLGDVGTNAQ